MRVRLPSLPDTNLSNSNRGDSGAGKNLIEIWGMRHCHCFMRAETPQRELRLDKGFEVYMENGKSDRAENFVAVDQVHRDGNNSHMAGYLDVEVLRHRLAVTAQK